MEIFGFIYQYIELQKRNELKSKVKTPLDVSFRKLLTQKCPVQIWLQLVVAYFCQTPRQYLIDIDQISTDEQILLRFRRVASKPPRPKRLQNDSYRVKAASLLSITSLCLLAGFYRSSCSSPRQLCLRRWWCSPLWLSNYFSPRGVVVWCFFFFLGSRGESPSCKRSPERRWRAVLSN